MISITLNVFCITDLCLARFTGFDGTSHNIDDWKFDPVTGQVVDGKGGKPNQWCLSSLCQQSPRNGSLQGLEVKMVIRWH